MIICSQLLCTTRHQVAICVGRILAMRTINCNLELTVVTTDNPTHSGNLEKDYDMQIIHLTQEKDTTDEYIWAYCDMDV